jgi:hypothetical protein
MANTLQQMQQLQQRLPVQQVGSTRLVLTFPTCWGTVEVVSRRSEILRESRSHRHHKSRVCELRSRHESLVGRKNKCLSRREITDHQVSNPSGGSGTLDLRYVDQSSLWNRCTSMRETRSRSSDVSIFGHRGLVSRHRGLVSS